MLNRFLQDLTGGEPGGRWVRLETLTTLRWLAVLGQITAAVAAHQFFGAELPKTLCAMVIGASVALNIVMRQILPANARLGRRTAMFSMQFDLVQVSALLALTGGLANPFAMLLLAPVTISASALDLRSAVIIALTALGLISAMAIWSLPLVFADGSVLETPAIQIFGVWVALTISVLFMTLYSRRVSMETFRMSRALREAEAALAREQRMTAIGALAAAAAHELGTPLATIKLVSGELADELKSSPELLEDAELIREQAERCRLIFSDLAQGGRSDEQMRRAPVSAVLEEAAKPHMERGKRIIMRIGGEPAEEVGGAQPVIRRTPELVHGLRNLVQNAVDFADSTIWIDIDPAGEGLRLTIGDDGPGYAGDLLERLGDPYVTSRPRAASVAGRGGMAGGRMSGMGLGLFITKTLLERTGGRVSFANAPRRTRRANRGVELERRRPTGALAVVIWPAGTIVSGRDEARGALGHNQRFTFSNI